MRRVAACACIAALLSVMGVLAQEAGDWADWPYVRQIAIETTAARRLISVPLPGEIYRRARPRLDDLRVIDDRHHEVPFLVHTPRGIHRQEWRPVRLLETSFLPGAYTQVVVDTGMPVRLHNSIELTLHDTDFFAWVEVAASSDGSTWRILNERLPLYRFTADGHGGNQVLTYAQSSSRFLRLRLLEASEALTVRGARVSEEIVDEPERVMLAAAIAPADDLPERHSGWRVDFGDGIPPASEASFTTSEPEFHRPVRVRASDDGRRWRPVGGGEIYRLRRPAGTMEALRVSFMETSARYLQIEMFNRNDSPLPDLAVQIRGVPRRVVFRQEPERRYRLVYGFPRAQAADYELARLIVPGEIAAAAGGVLGEEAPMPGHPRPQPWTERHPIVLWLALGLAIVVLGWLALRSMRSAT